MSKMKCGTQFQARPFRAFEDAVTHMNRILQMRKQDTLLDHQIAHAISPNGQTIFESKFSQEIGALKINLSAGAFLAAERNDIVSAEPEKFGDMTPHHHAPKWRGQCRDQQSMITPCDCAGDCARGITAETVRDEPLAVEQEFARHLRIVPRHRARNRSTNLASFIHEIVRAPNEFSNRASSVCAAELSRE